MAFGPEGILFIGDSKSAEVIAVDMSQHPSVDNTKVNIKNVDGLLADLLGTSKDQIQITEMTVNPANNNIYLSVNHSSGTPLLFMVKGDGLVSVPLSPVSHSKISLANPIDADAKDRRGRDMRKWAISDLNYSNGKVMVTGLSNQEFGSTFRSIDFPFDNNQMHASLEIYHAAHGKYETQSPIKTFTTTTLNGQEHLVASYTCTPLVIFPLDNILPGQHTKGRTVAEFGSNNSPIDIIEMEKEGKRYLLMSNSSRALMKIKVSDIEEFGESLTTKVEERSATAGIDFINLPFVNVLQLDKLDDSNFLMLQRQASGDLVLRTGSDRWL